jgi:hypothetical protein
MKLKRRHLLPLVTASVIVGTVTLSKLIKGKLLDKKIKESLLKKSSTLNIEHSDQPAHAKRIQTGYYLIKLLRFRFVWHQISINPVNIF